MMTNRIFSLAAVAAFVGLAACNGADQRVEQTEREILTEPATETVEVEVMTEDTLMVERTVETEVHVDTIRDPDLGTTPPGTTTPGTTTPGTTTPGATTPGTTGAPR